MVTEKKTMYYNNQVVKKFFSIFSKMVVKKSYPIFRCYSASFHQKNRQKFALVKQHFFHHSMTAHDLKNGKTTKIMSFRQNMCS